MVRSLRFLTYSTRVAAIKAHHQISLWTTPSSIPTGATIGFATIFGTWIVASWATLLPFLSARVIQDLCDLRGRGLPAREMLFVVDQGDTWSRPGIMSASVCRQLRNGRRSPALYPCPLSSQRLFGWVVMTGSLPVAASEDDRLGAPESLLKVRLSLSRRRFPFREAHENGPQ